MFSKQIILLLCCFSATSSWLVAFPGFEEADLEEEYKTFERDFSDGLTTSTPTAEPGPAASSVHPTQTSSSSSMMNSISTTASEVGTQTTKVDLSVKETSTSTNAENSFGVSIKQVVSTPHDFQRLTFEKQGHSLVVAGMFMPDLEGKLAQYEEKINELKAKDPLLTRQTEQERKVFTDASEIIKAGQQYFQNVMEESGKKAFWNTKQPIVSFATALNQEQEMLNKNINKIIEIATRVEELHKLKNKWTIACNELQEEGQAESGHGVLLNTQINKVQEAINQYLQFAETIRDKDIIEKDNPRKPALMATAKEAKETGHANYYSVLEFEARKQHADYTRQAWEARNQGNMIQAKRYQDAAEAANEATDKFQGANKRGISEDEQNAYNLSGHQRLKQAEAIIQENEAEAERYKSAAWSAYVAANQFRNANKARISEDEQKARHLSAHYFLQQAEAIIQGNVIQAQQYQDAALAANAAADKFQLANKRGISEDEKNAWNLSGHQRLKQAAAIIQGNMIQAQRYDEAVLAMNAAVDQFQRANKTGISEDEQKARHLSAHYFLQQAEAIIQGNVIQAQQYQDAALAANAAAAKFQVANKRGISEDEKNAWNLSGHQRLKQAEAIIQENEAEAERYDEAVLAMNAAVDQFQRANKTGISEDEKNAYNLSGHYRLKQAEAIIQGNVIQSKQYDNAALAANAAAGQFQGANKTGISEDEKNAWNLSARYCLQQAEAIIQGNVIQTQRYDNAASAMGTALGQFQDANQERISEDEKNARNLSARHYLQQAQAIIEGKEMEVKQYGEAARITNDAAYQFKEANRRNISEEQRSHFIQQGNALLTQAKRLSDQITDARKQKEAQERREQETKEWHREYNSRSSFKRGL